MIHPCRFPIFRTFPINFMVREKNTCGIRRWGWILPDFLLSVDQSQPPPLSSLRILFFFKKNLVASVSHGFCPCRSCSLFVGQGETPPFFTCGKKADWTVGCIPQNLSACPVVFVEVEIQVISCTKSSWLPCLRKKKQEGGLWHENEHCK